jgi:ATP phosphoribosyltransferase
VENFPKMYTLIHEAFDPTIGLALICRKGECIEPEKWTSKNKILIAAEHICQVTRFFEKNNIHHQTYHLDKVTGSSEGFLINSDKYLLADAVVESGRTLDENNLEIWKVIIPKGQVRIGLYQRCF